MNDHISQLLRKFDVPTPRYTSYPTVPYWEPETMNGEVWKQSIRTTLQNENGEMSVYVHLPFCENMCTFCACTKRITVNHKVETPYLESVLKEWAMYREALGQAPILREIHLGGGTPTFFSPENLKKLIQGITKDSIVPAGHEFSVEVHPNFTTREHLVALAEVGFNRISMGVQDFDETVQYIINRNQTYTKTKEVVDWARELNYNSVNIDLVYGLPRQTVESVALTIEYIEKLHPDRIAYYSYAHVPWKSKVQRRYTEADLPTAAQKWEMYQRGRELLTAKGYVAIGMDHFALADDKLFLHAEDGKMHRNFMGYTTTITKLIVGLGASSIGDAWDAFAQNEKEIEEYQERVDKGEFPLVNGHLLNEEDVIIRRNILDLMCTNKTIVDRSKLDPKFVEHIFHELKKLEGDDLVKVTGDLIEVTETGKMFIRNISAALDARLWRTQMGTRVFSQAI